jgi:hypothetical protein
MQNNGVKFTKKPKEKARSSEWPEFRKKFLLGKCCAVCGGVKKLEAHHILPFHLFPRKELDTENLIALCESRNDLNCHLVFGHLGDFKSYNVNVIVDAKTWSIKFKCKPQWHR